MQLLLLAGLALLPIDLGEPILDARVADIDADGQEDVVAVGKKYLHLLRSGKGPAIRREAPTLTVIGKGLFGFTSNGYFGRVKDPFGQWKHGKFFARSLIGAHDRAEPRIVVSPGDLNGDGIDDPLLVSEEGFKTGAGLVPLRPEARLSIERNEHFAVEWTIPVPAIGNWSGQGRELVFFHGRTLTAWLGTKCTAREETKLGAVTKDANRLTRHHVLIRDVNRNGRLDLLAVSAKGATGFFGAFEAVAYLFLDGKFRIAKTGKFHRPAATLKVQGALMEPRLLDLDSDGDLDLALATINTSILASATGNAPGSYLLFRFENNTFGRKPAWNHSGPIPLTAFTAHPQPPTIFLPDLDGNKRPEALDCSGKVTLLEATPDGGFEEVSVANDFERTGPPAHGEQRAAIPGKRGVLIVEATR